MQCALVIVVLPTVWHFCFDYEYVSMLHTGIHMGYTVTYRSMEEEKRLSGCNDFDLAAILCILFIVHYIID